MWNLLGRVKPRTVFTDAVNAGRESILSCCGDTPASWVALLCLVRVSLLTALGHVTGFSVRLEGSWNPSNVLTGHGQDRQSRRFLEVDRRRPVATPVHSVTALGSVFRRELNPMTWPTKNFSPYNLAYTFYNVPFPVTNSGNTGRCLPLVISWNRNSRKLGTLRSVRGNQSSRFRFSNLKWISSNSRLTKSSDHTLLFPSLNDILTSCSR